MRIAVIGSGISGLGAAWLLSRRHDVEVSRVRGHVFNPVSYIYRPRPDGSLQRAVAEVDDILGDNAMLPPRRPSGPRRRIRRSVVPEAVARIASHQNGRHRLRMVLRAQSDFELLSRPGNGAPGGGPFTGAAA